MKILWVSEDNGIFKEVSKLVDTNEIDGEFFYCFSGEEALRRGMEDNWDIVLLDIDLVYEDSLEILQRIRSRDRDVYIIMIARREDWSLIKRALDWGGNDFIYKPLNRGEFLFRFKVAVRKRKENIMAYNTILAMQSAAALKKVGGV